MTRKLLFRSQRGMVQKYPQF